MANFSYPTQAYVEQFLNNEFPNFAPFNLNPSTSLFGNLVDYHTTPGIFGTLRGAVIHEAPITGLDIPVLISDDFVPKGIVMIIEQDPLRIPTNIMLRTLSLFFKSHCIVGTPNALHYNVSCYPRTKIYRDIINYILSKHYYVYITDANKLYWPYDSSSTAMSRWLGHTNQQTLLQQEINAINPCTVLLVGNVAQTAFGPFKSSFQNVVDIPHIKARANAWAKYGVIPATNNNILNYIKKRLP